MAQIIHKTNKEKFTSKLEYSVAKEEDYFTGKNKVTYRYLDITITAKNEEITKELWFDLYEYLKENSNIKLGWVGCPSVDENYKNNKVSCYDSLVIYDKEEFDELKELYKEWKLKKRTN